MTIQRSWGPQINVGVNPAIGTTTPTFTGPAPYVSGTNENPDAGPEVSYAGFALRDFRIFSRPDGAGLVAGGYPNQDFAAGLMGGMLTADFVPSTIAVANIAAAAALVASTPMTLVTSSGAGITVLTTAFLVPGFPNNVIPAGSLLIDAAPTYHAYGTSGAVEVNNGAAVGRAVSLTATTGAQNGINVTVRGWDVYGFPITQTLAGPGTGLTVNTLKGFKWIAANGVTPSGAGTGTMSVGTADIFEFPLRSDKFSDTLIWWNNALITANTGFVAASTTSPNTAALGSTRGTYAVQSASDGTKALQIRQFIRPANSDTVAGTWGVTMI